MYQYKKNIVTFINPEDIEPEARQQLENVANMPFIFKHLAVMPDCHWGMGATVGSVIATKNAIIPAAVGVDIGCGMIAVRTKFTANDLPDSLRETRIGIERRIPLGAGAYNKNLSEKTAYRIQSLIKNSHVTSDYLDSFTGSWKEQLGSLGSGNHFIELCLDEQQRIWAVLHSGSRGIGNKMAMKHIKVAQKLMDDAYIQLIDKDLAYLTDKWPEFKAYIDDLHWAQNFALHNREEMMDRVMTELSYLFYKEGGHEGEIEQERINCHHNFTQMERHFGQDVWITRKGAIQMKKGQKGVIPGSMGTNSYIVSGLENRMSFHSAPHGAGRKMSRKKAKETFSMDELAEQMTGVEYKHSEEFLDEIPSAYKDIGFVMENSNELVQIEHELKQILNVKGS